GAPHPFRQGPGSTGQAHPDGGGPDQGRQPRLPGQPRGAGPLQHPRRRVKSHAGTLVTGGRSRVCLALLTVSDITWRAWHRSAPITPPLPRPPESSGSTASTPPERSPSSECSSFTWAWSPWVFSPRTGTPGIRSEEHTSE